MIHESQNQQKRLQDADSSGSVIAPNKYIHSPEEARHVDFNVERKQFSVSKSKAVTDDIKQMLTGINLQHVYISVEYI